MTRGGSNGQLGSAYQRTQIRGCSGVGDVVNSFDGKHVTTLQEESGESLAHWSPALCKNSKSRGRVEGG